MKNDLFLLECIWLNKPKYIPYHYKLYTFSELKNLGFRLEKLSNDYYQIYDRRFLWADIQRMEKDARVLDAYSKNLRYIRFTNEIPRVSGLNFSCDEFSFPQLSDEYFFRGIEMHNMGEGLKALEYLTFAKFLDKNSHPIYECYFNVNFSLQKYEVIDEAFEYYGVHIIGQFVYSDKMYEWIRAMLKEKKFELASKSYYRVLDVFEQLFSCEINNLDIREVDFYRNCHTKFLIRCKAVAKRIQDFNEKAKK